MRIESLKSSGVLLEINFGNPCGAALSAECEAWSVINSTVVSSECTHFVLMGETDMSQDSHSDGYHKLVKNISSAFPKATIFYYGKQPNELAPEKAKNIGCKPVYKWLKVSNNNDSNSGSQECPIIWYCFSHRCMTSPLVKRMIQKQVLSPSQSSQWYDFDIVTRMKASMIIQRAWRSYLVNVSSVVLSLSSIKVVDNCLMEAMANCLLRSHKQQLTLATQSVGLSTSTPEDLCDSCPHMPIQEKPSSISPRVRDFKKRVRYFKKLESPSLQAVQPSFLLYHSSKRNPYAAFIEPQPIVCR